MLSTKNLNRITDYLWEVPKTYRADMLVPARVFANRKILDDIFRDRSLEQLINVATLPGIQKYAVVMPDTHEGYGFPIGGVAAMIYPDGVISPGGIGYDINCGVRLLKSQLTLTEIKSSLETLSRELYREIPSGVGRGGKLKLTNKELDRVLEQGVGWIIKQGYGNAEDSMRIESSGSLYDADPALVSEQAKNRGRDQLGTMGAGNHFVEVQKVDEVFDEESAGELGLFKHQITIMIHTGSRGLGHQVATDYIKKMISTMPKYGIKLPDIELACAPFSSPEGKNYFKAMSAAANFAWSNRGLITWEVRRVWKRVLGENGGGLEIVYDVAHNIAKVEDHNIGGVVKKVIVHRKGATKSFPGQPVLIPGSMGTASYVLIGSEKSMDESFGSSCHGAGRTMSRHAAKRAVRGSELKEQLEQKGIRVQSGSMSGLAEEAPLAYKDVDEVVEVVHQAGIARKVARLRPVAVIKG
jgi:tRNA-splicing ligase RtcB